MILNRDFKEFFELLNAHNVRYLVVGGYAVAFHGHPRYTRDVDVWIERTRSNAENTVNALNAFGLGSVGLKVDDFLQANQIFQLGNPPNRIDLIMDLQAVDFADCHDSKETVDIEGVHVHFIDLENLKRNKRAVGRHQDLADLDNLQ